MKKSLLLIVCVCTVLTSSAQLKVKDGGNTIAGADDFSSSYYIQMGASSAQTSGYNIGVAGKTEMTNASGISCGVYGNAKGTGKNYGVAGDLNSSCTNGAAILGSTLSALGQSISGKYAGYFYGNTYVNGTLTATQVVQTSDKRLKENISPLSLLEKSTLNKVLDMNIVSYNYKQQIPDGFSLEEVAKSTGVCPEQKHIGVIAQELQAIYPELVVEGQDGYLAVNYVEMVPILIRCIQELSQKVTDLEEEINSTTSFSGSSTDVDGLNTKKNVLYPNNPNPFKERTVIRFTLADDATNAFICIFDMSGKMLRKLPVSSNDSNVSINGGELGEGMFFYTLIVNGREIDTKRMIISK